MTPGLLVSLGIKESAALPPQKKVLQSFSLVIDSGEVFILSHTSDSITDKSVLSITDIPRMQNEGVYTLSKCPEPVPAIPESLDKGFGVSLWCWTLH